MPDKIQILRGHAFKVRLLAALSGFVLLVGTVFAGWEDFSGRSVLGRAGQWGVTFGFFGLVAAGILVRYARCPDCRTLMKQGGEHDQEKYDGIFVCPGCSKSWLTEERSRMRGGVE
jgi:hypothetical protein